MDDIIFDSDPEHRASQAGKALNFTYDVAPYKPKDLPHGYTDVYLYCGTHKVLLGIYAYKKQNQEIGPYPERGHQVQSIIDLVLFKEAAEFRENDMYIVLENGTWNFSKKISGDRDISSIKNRLESTYAELFSAMTAC